MRTLGNIIWLVFGGFWLALGYLIAGLINCILIITIPFGIASFRLAAYAIWPFGRTVVDKPGAGVMSGIGNILWLLFGGLWMALVHLVTAGLLFLTIIGIPLAMANLRMIPLTLMPLGKDIVPAGRGQGFAGS